MNNATSHTLSIFNEYFSSSDMELVNMIQSGASLACTLIILAKLFDVTAFFGSVQKKRQDAKKAREKKELDRIRKLFDSLHNNTDLVLSSDDDNEKVPDAGVMRIAHKKTKPTVLETRV